MQLHCLNCQALIPAEEINLQTQWAKCTNCDSIFTIQALSESAEKISQIVNVSTTPPNETMFRIENFNNEIKIITPPSSIASQLPLMIFAGFWMCFITVWTSLAAMGSGWFAAFSIPFWLVGIGMWLSILNNLLGSESIIIRQSEIEVRRDRLPIPYKKIYSLSQVQNILFESREYTGLQMSKGRSSKTTYKDGIVLQIGAKEELLFQGLKTVEGNWLRDYLKKNLGIFK